MTNRRIKETIGIRYDDIKLMPAIVKDVKAMLQSHEDIDTTKTLIVNFNAFNASSVDFFIYTFSRTVVWEEFHAVKQDVLLKIADIIEKHGAEIAYPTQTLHIARNSDEEN
jgi:MscS family membrane protein